VVRDESKSVPDHSIDPAAGAISIRWCWCSAAHHRTSLVTHGEAADRGEATRMNQLESARARSMLGHSAGVADRLVLSRKIRRARGRYQGRANRCSSDWSASASSRSSAWLYEMNAS
jgi:hypothetical protein